ncbi:MAG: acetate/propionate family kinase, partial [Planctomycetota bacterium]
SLQALFPGRERLTPRAPLSQPGLFLAEERVDVLGPRERLAAVPVVGPLRERPQVEVCQSDEFRLGLDAPRRPSGRLDDAAPVTLVGPGGSLSLAAALINPMRHLHLDPADARARGLRDGDRLTARVERSGAGERPLEGVLVRVQPGARPELHVDEDEARALGLPAPPPGEVLWTVPGASVRLLRRRPTLRLEPKG